MLTVGDSTYQTIATAIGVLAVVLLLLGYLQKHRLAIVLLGLVSRLLFIVQYGMLGATEGMVMNGCVAVCFELARRRDRLPPAWRTTTFVISNLLCVVCGVLTYRSPVSLLPVGGILFHVNGAWRQKEKHVRAITLAGCPLWLTYNLLSGVYASCVGDVLSMVVIISSIIRYDLPQRKAKQQ